jgi:hypothetical protein
MTCLVKGADHDDDRSVAVALDCEVADLVDVFTGRDLRKLIPRRK